MKIAIHSGVEIDLQSLDLSQVTLKDIAVALARINRFNGATTRPLSVLEHSVFGTKLVLASTGDKELAKSFFAHDWHEFITGDITRPFAKFMKIETALNEYKKKIDAALAKKFGIEFNYSFNHKIDYMVLNYEIKYFTKFTDYDVLITADLKRPMTDTERNEFELIELFMNTWDMLQ